MADKLISFYELVKEFNTHCGGDCEFCDHHLRVHGKSKTRCLILNSLRAVDAVEVVRCRECELHRNAGCPMRSLHVAPYGYAIKDNTSDNGFCHMGRRNVATDNNVGHKDGGAD